MDLGELIPILGIVFVIGVPVTALAAHFVLRPMVRDITESILALRGGASPDIHRRLTELEEGQRLIDRRLESLIEADRFHHTLDSGDAT
jgi:hypothetical protein